MRLDSGESLETKQYCPQSQGTVTKQVCNINSLNKICKDDLAEGAKNFKAGCLQNYITKWESLTNEPAILDAVKHYHIEFSTGYPVQSLLSKYITFSSSEQEIIEAEIGKLFTKGVIIENTTSEPGEFISTVFVRMKKDGTHMMILNLKQLNEHVAYHHFKMDTIQTALKLMHPGCFMASVDLKDAYYSVPVAKEDRKFLRFQWGATLFQFTCLPFTKLLKPVYAHIRSIGHTCMGQIDDSLLVGYDYTVCHRNIIDTVGTFCNLGFIIHPQKSIFEPKQEIEFLVFLLNSISRTTRLPTAKAGYVKTACVNLLGKSNNTIRELAHVIGLLVSSLPGVQFGELHYQKLEINKTAALQSNKGNYDAVTQLTQDSMSDFIWWVQNIDTAYKNKTVTSPDIIFTTDASMKGWG